MTSTDETEAIELYLSEDLPHDLPWNRLSAITQEGYRQRVRDSKKPEEPTHGR